MSYDFKYYGFGVYFENIKTYIANIEAHRKKIKFRSSYEPFYAQGIIEGMIHAIADKDVQFDVKDVMLCRILEEMIIKGGYNNAGVYTDAAHKALRNLYIMQGKDPNSCVLYNKTIGGTMDHMKSKLKNFFGLDKKKCPGTGCNEAEITIKHTIAVSSADTARKNGN